LEVSFFCYIFAVPKDKKTFIMINYANLKKGDVLAITMNASDTDENKPEMVNKAEFIAKVKRWLELETDWNMEYDEEGRNDNYGKIDELVKYLEE
jgi:hypothetical protein